MNSERTILKNTVVLASGKALGDLCTFLFLVYFARIFGTDILGKYAFSMAVGGALTVFVSLGLNTLLVRDVSRDRGLTKKYVFNLLVIQGLLAIVIWIFIVLLASALPVNTDSRIIMILIGTYHVFYRMTMLLRSQFRAHEEMQYSAFLEAFHKIVILVLAVPAIIIWNNAIITLAAYPASALIMFIMGFWISMSRYGRMAWSVDFPLMRSLLGKAMPFLAILLLGEFYTRLGIILLTFFHGESAAGIYAAGDRLVVTVMAGVQNFGGALLPAMSRLSVGDREALLKLFERSVRLMLVAALPLCTMLFLLRGPVIHFLFGSAYFEATSVFGIRCWSVVFIGLNVVLSGFLIVHHRQRQWVKLQAVTVVGYGILCLVLIPLYNYTGLASARLITEAVVFLGAYAYIRKQFYSLPMLRMGTGPVLACATTILAFYLLDDFGPRVAIPAAGAVCVTTMFLFRAVRIQDFKFAKRVLLATDASSLEGQIVIPD